MQLCIQSNIDIWRIIPYLQAFKNVFIRLKYIRLKYIPHSLNIVVILARGPNIFSTKCV